MQKHITGDSPLTVGQDVLQRRRSKVFLLVNAVIFLPVSVDIQLINAIVGVLCPS